ncbi:MAG TPA: DegT/DnrJ/EryC1/StrS family aminotransferase [Allosphingosinicella sp.]
MPDPIFITRPYLPPLAELMPLLEEIWETRQLSNNGPFHQQLEARLRELLEVDHIALVTNGMVALEMVIDAAGLAGEIVTTPYSFVATTHAVTRGRLKPVFVDVRPGDLNIDPARIEAAITPETSAIVAVHCYGNPCAVEEIDEIARRRGVRVIYDAAHAFGVTWRGRGVLGWGDFATLSFHATKAFNTFEGGAIAARTAADAEAIGRHRNFGIASEVEIPAIGTNAKMSEFNAAVGLVQLDHFDAVRRARAAVDRRYREALAGIPGITPLAIPEDVVPNHAYFPVLVGPDFAISRDVLHARLAEQQIQSRRYFYPLLSNLAMYRDLPSAGPDNLPVANRAAEQVLCLPIYPELAAADQDRVIEAIRAAARGG